MLLRQSYDIFQTYGKSPESLENMVLGFSLVLRPYNDQTIIAAFRYWMETQSILPTPADIKEVCYSKIPIYNSKPRTEQPEPEKKPENEMPQEEFDKWLAEQKNKMMAPDSEDTKKAKLEARTKTDYTHYNRMSEAQKEEFQKSFVDSHANLRAGKVVFGRSVAD